ncbi:microtubule-associated serine/threonine-protein kinase 3-like isoform X2 [Varroa jacobsoni]|nr:microtubule-associated serine/threonine-protein kinase 3-like isoform X2 [Varroa jacobsoni]
MHRQRVGAMFVAGAPTGRKTNRVFGRGGGEKKEDIRGTCDERSRQSASRIAARLTRKLILIMERISGVLEDYSGVNQTNWVKVAEVFHGEAKSSTHDLPPYKPAKFKYFTINRLLGSGGFGTIYKAHLGEVVCTIKIIPCELLTEAKHACVDKLVASMINSPFLVRYFACFSTKQAFITAMEYIRGCDLGKLLKVARSIPEDILRIIIAQLGEALEHMHTKGFIHRDVKPANLLMSIGCRVKLIDFDTAKTCIGKFVKKSQTCFNIRTPAEFFDSQIAGTVPYLAPECVTYRGYGRAMDWWAAGVTTFHLATGRLPFQRFRTQEELQRMIAAGFYRWPKDKVISHDLQEFVNALMQKKPPERLCSHQYLDFRIHPFFSGVEWRKLSTTDNLKEYPILKKCLGKTVSGYSPIGSVASGSRRYHISPANIVDTNDHSNLYTYCSAGFIRVMNELNNGRMPTIETITDPYDNSDDPEPEYIFERFLIF